MEKDGIHALAHPDYLSLDPAAGKGMPLKIKVEFDGNMFEGDKFGDGQGLFTSEGKEQYLGEFSEERETAHGYGVVVDVSGNTSSGQLSEGKWHGYVVHHFADGSIQYRKYARGKTVLWVQETKDGKKPPSTFDDNPEDAADAAAQLADLKRHALDAEVRHRPAVLTPPRYAHRLVFARGRSRRSESSKRSRC